MVENNELAPIVLFVYNRLDHTKQTVEALQKNILAKESELYIYSDGPKNSEFTVVVNEIRKYLKSVTGFRSVTVVERKKNWGLAASIIDGVTSVINQYGRIIVLEDDLLTSPNFLCYMNNALNYYQGREDIFSISGYTAPLKSLTSYYSDSYLTYRPSSWGWATWKNHWFGIDWKVKDFKEFTKNKEKVQGFNLGGNDMTRMLSYYMKGKNNSWAIRWAYAMYKQNKYSVYPKVSKIQNIGFGKDATHCTGVNVYKTSLDHSLKCDFSFTNDSNPNKTIAKEFKYQYSYTNKLIKKILGLIRN